MLIDPRLQGAIDALRTPFDTSLTAAEHRAKAREAAPWFLPMIMTPGPDLLSVTDADADGVPVRVYRPREGLLPVVVFLHGGGWWKGTLDEKDPACRRRALAADCVVVSVDYRLAPENPFPAGLDDCWAALRWVAASAADLGVDPTRIVIAGESAGGNLAAAVAQRARNAGSPALVGQLLDVPAVDLTLQSPSIKEFFTTFEIPQPDRPEYLDDYLGSADPAHWEISPLLGDLEGLPPTLILTADCDPIRDDGARYATALREAGVPVVLTNWEGMLHGTHDLDVLVPDMSEAYTADVVGWLRERWTSASPGRPSRPTAFFSQR